MAVSDAYRDYVLEQIGGVPGLSWRRMFGGVGVYSEGAFFAVMDDDQVFFRVSDATRPAYVARGAGPFAPMGDDKPMMGYFEVPADVLDDRAAARAWALEAIAAARAAKAKGSRAKRPASKPARRTAARERMEKPARGITAGGKGGVSAADILRPFPPRIRALANRLRALVKKAAPGLEERPYPGWKAVGFRGAECGYVCGVFPFDDGVRLIFEHGAKLDDPDGLLEGRGKVRQVRYVTVRRPADVKVRALARLVRAALAHGVLRRAR